MTSLADKTCVPCRGGVPSLKGKELEEIYHQLPEHAQWNVVDEHHLVRGYKFPDFRTALAFVNKVGAAGGGAGAPSGYLAWLGQSGDHDLDARSERAD